jgi:hypothetical protein
MVSHKGSTRCRLIAGRIDDKIFCRKEICMDILKITALFFCITIKVANAQVNSPLNFNNSPLNYENSLLNYENSPLNYNNSPLNYQNSPNNYSATNGVYDNKGNRIGYETKSPAGVTNIYDNRGNRIGYQPSSR